MSDFVVASLTPLDLPHAGLALATARAGGVALLDAAAGGLDPEAAHRSLRALLDRAPAGARLGLRLSSGQAAALAPLLADLAGRLHLLVLTDPEDSAAADLAAPGRELWAEVAVAETAVRLGVQLGTLYCGVLARGQECGGFTAGDPAFILAQKLAQAQLKVPFWVQGGIGPHTAAACRAAGAAGVVLDDQLWLMPESPLPAAWQVHLAEADGQEAATLGDDLGVPCRVFHRRDLSGAGALKRLADQLARDPRDLAERQAEWREQAGRRLGWGPPQDFAWPTGQGVGLAGLFRARYRTTGRLIQAVRTASRDHLEAGARLAPLAPGAPLAVAHGTQFPLVQGPMTRVSDTPAFAAAVADAGGLPLLALALMGEEPTRVLLRETEQRLAGRPWGVGILGFVTPERRAEQLRAIADIHPPFALIAGGWPDQVAALEQRGVKTYLHVSIPSLLRRFFDQGVRRFVFEGRECGGHVGPLSSFALWEEMIETLLDHVPARALGEVSVLFAGGLHDALSAAMVSAAAAPLAEHGVRVGALLGSAYLFTEEAVATGAITEAFQQEALACAETVELQTGGGHTIRCAPTPYAEEFQALRGRLLREEVPADQIRIALDDLNLGRARLASKGVVREDEAAAVQPAPLERQQREGMYMMGRLATLRSAVTTMPALHAEVSEGAGAVLAAAAGALVSEPARPARTRPAEVAVVGLACLVPGARDPQTFWRNLLQKTEVVTEVPAHRWDWRVIYSPDPKAPDKTASKWGGFFDEVPFDPLRFGIPPNSMRSLSTSQLLTLEVVRWAFEDAGYESGNFDRENTAVIIGTGANGDLEQHYLIRSALPFLVPDPAPEIWQRLPEWTEESFAGVLANVTAGRVANRFDLGGANYTVDSACASSLTVIDLALSELTTGRSNMVVAAGLDFEQTPYFFQGFSRVQAVSPTGFVRTFDQGADGIVISEGVAVVLLKRLADAERDGDQIYAVIQSATGSSDGKALGMTAPRSIGQRRALRRAYEEAGCAPSSIGLYEAHGTGTPVGDRAELETVVAVLEEAGAAPDSCAIGSVKSLLGHTKAAAGMVGLTKAVLALHHKTLPPHAHVERPLATIEAPDCPAYLLQEARPWLAPLDGGPRRAGVSAFGFGGTNFHAVVEEYRGGFGWFDGGAVGEEQWPWELVVLRGTGRDGLLAELNRLTEALAGLDGWTWGGPRLVDLGFTCALRAQERRAQPAVLALVADSVAGLKAAAVTVAGRLAAGTDDPQALIGPLGALGWEAAAAPGALAVLFPGQGSQAPDMAREAALYLPELRAALELAERTTAGCFDRPLGQIVYPPAAFTDEEREAQRARLDHTRAAQPALGALAAGFLDFARRLGLEPAMAAGHSYGELAALHAAGALAREDFLRLSEMRGRLMAEAPLAAGEGETGGMAAVQLPAEEVGAHLSEGDGVVIANRNAPGQCVLSGPRAALAAASERLTAAGVRVRPLPVSGAFHSPLMAAAAEPLASAIAACPVAAPALPVYGNATAAPYPTDSSALRAQLAAHLTSPVDFVSQVRQMHADGARVFLELGPGRVLTGLVDRILEGEPHLAVPLDGGGLKGLFLSLGKLIAGGLALDLPALFAGRRVERLELDRLAPPPLPATVWMVDGGRVRRPGEPFGSMGRLPLLTQETIEQARAEKAQPQPAAAPALAVTPAVAPPSITLSTPAPRPAATAPLSAPAPQSSTVALEAYRAYQETMRQFLALQENVMARVLGQPAAALSTIAPAVQTTLHIPAAPAWPVQPAAAAPPPVPAPPTQAPIAPPLPSALAALAVLAPAGGNGHGETKAAPPAPAQLDRLQVTATMIALVAERTGYPADMLDLKQDIEADLGIDSIKRIEILDAFRKDLPESLRQATEGRMEQLVREKSLAGWVETVMGLAAEAPAAAAVASIAPAPSNGHGAPGNGAHPAIPAPVALDRERMTATMVSLVAERTGYPAEMLDLKQDIEADLGIDSIKRIEILDAFRKDLPESLRQATEGRMEQLVREKSLAGWVETVMALAAETLAHAGTGGPGNGHGSGGNGSNGSNGSKGAQHAQAHGVATSPAAAAVSIADIEPCPRYVIRAVASDLPAGDEIPATGLFLVTADELGVAPLVAEALRGRGARVEIVERTALAVPGELDRLVPRLLESGPLQGVVHLAPLAAQIAPATLDDWRGRTQTEVKSLFDLLRLTAPALDVAGDTACVLGAVLLGGAWGRTGTFGPGSPASGGIYGLLKTLQTEHPRVHARAVDFDEADPAACAERVVRELLQRGEGFEIGYPGGRRTVFLPEPMPLAAPAGLADLQPREGWVVLVTGGARGITAELARRLAAPGVRMAVVGRSPLAPEDPTLAGLADAAALRRHLLEQARTAGAKVTPVAIEEQVRRVLRQREMRRNLSALEERGAEVEYLAADAGREDGLGRVITGLYERYGRIDAVLHGAGVIEDRLLRDKTSASFERVFDTKADSAFLLSRALRPETLRWVVLMSSISGRIGNRGQIDYAAANEVMNRLAWEMAWKWPETRVVAINWGPWSGAGMADEAVLRELEARGIRPIGLEQGWRFLQNELAAGAHVEVIAGSGV